MNWETVLIAAITAVPPTLVAWAALRQTKKTDREINSRMTQLLELTRKDALAEGAESERVRTLPRLS